MNASPQIWLWVSAGISLIVGLLLVMSDSGAGWFLILMGIVDIGIAAQARRGLAASNRSMTRWGLIAVTLLLVALVLIVAEVFLRSA